MVALTAISLLIGALVVLAWYACFVALNRRRGRRAIDWLEKALSGQGKVLGTRWVRASVMQAALRLRTSVFRQPSVFIQLTPQEMPLSWLTAWWRREPSALIFQADLDFPPGFNLEVRNHRWCGRTTRRFSPHPERWSFEHATPLVLTSRPGWEREVTGMMNALLSCREREFLSLAFRRNSPHFVATVTLESIAPDIADHANVFEMLRELAAGASTFR